MRYPAVAGRFYPSDRSELTDLVENCFYHECGPGSIPDSEGTKDVRCILAPHAGIAVSGPIAAHAFAELKRSGHRDAYIIIGPDHYGQPFDLVMCSDPYLTPMGECKVNMELAGRLRERIRDSPNAHRFEHSIEVELPFLQFIDPDAEIVPIIMGRQDLATAQKLAEAIVDSVGDMDVAIIASSDLMHYVPDRVEKELDSKFLDHVLAHDIGGMYDTVRRYDMTVCGYGPIAAALMASDPTESKLLCHSNSWETIHYDRDAVVGYAAAIFE
ncbi:MAG: AmmeMemoRadiSam system protein B [Candidatus Methanomethylophilaceae archaeon]|nr:AmmeMemoRadiSam system protein B [Candidatus Methanomethylophilaceae archaeon]